MGDMKQVWEGATGTAKRCRTILKAKFPGVKFSVRSQSYSGGSSVHIDWTDGPLTGAVEALVKVWEGASFDGMQDLKEYKDVVAVDASGEMVQIHGADFIFCQRSRTPAREAQIVEEMRGYWADHCFQEFMNGPEKYMRMNESEARLVAAGK